MRTGDFKHLVSFLATVAVQDPDNGDLVNTEVVKATSWAKITPLTGTRALNAGQILSGKPYDIQVRFRNDVDINESLEINWKGKRFAIHSVVNADLKEQVLLITAYEVKRKVTNSVI